MAGKRVHELAKELKLTSRQLIEELGKLGVTVSSNLSSVDEKTEIKLRKRLESKKAEEPVKKPVKPREVKKKGTTVKPVEEVKAKAEERKKVTAKKSAKTEAIKTEGEGTEERPTPDSALAERKKRVEIKRPERQFKKQAPSESVAVEDTGGEEATAEAVEKERILDLEKAEEREARETKEVRKEVSEEQNPPVDSETEVKAKKLRVSAGISVKEFSQKVGKSPAEIIKMLMNLGEMITINQSISDEALHVLAEELGYELEIKGRFLEEEEKREIERPEDLQPRPPVVTVMGHVDHGKTSLLDAIRMTDVISQEYGGITQHIGAYQVKYNERSITFIDTPGHESFTALRARGAQVTDIAVLVVAADDGVMPQTVEAIDHAHAAGVPIIVAVNKIDKEGANPLRVRQELTEYNLVPEEWGGDTIFVDVSAKQKTNLDKLLESILLLTDLYELKANYEASAKGTIIEARLDKGRGPVATVLVQRGTLKTGDAIVAGSSYGRIRALLDDKGRKIDRATPSMPVEILGLSSVPNPGDEFQVVEDEKKARNIAQERALKERILAEQRVSRHISLEELFSRIKEGELQDLNLILKCDVQGSVEAVVDSIAKLDQQEVKINILHKGVGAITENDVMLASASNAIVIGFNVRPDHKARELAEKEKVDIRIYRVIYQLIDDLQAAKLGLLEPEFEEVQTGYVEVITTFRVPRVGVIAGSQVKEGEITRNSKVRLVREGKIIYEGRIASLKRFKDDVRSVQAGFECGIALENFQDIKEGDIIEVYELREKPREASL
jgi:translation initiation factor IF-2